MKFQSVVYIGAVLWYYCNDEDMDGFNHPSYRPMFESLVEEGILVHKPHSTPQYRITTKGRHYIDRLRAVKPTHATRRRNVTMAPMRK